MDGVDTPAVSNTLTKVITELKAREELGKVKYGTTLDRNDLGLLDWLTHHKEELMDAVLYVQRTIDLLKGTK